MLLKRNTIRQVFIVIILLHYVFLLITNNTRKLNGLSSGSDTEELQVQQPPKEQWKLTPSLSPQIVVDLNTSFSGSNTETLHVQQPPEKQLRKPKEYYIGKEVLLQDDLSPLVHFAYIGHSKCGSSSIKKWFKREDLFLSNKEDKIMEFGPIAAVKYAYKHYPKDVRIGYKSPIDIYHNVSLPTIQNYFPRTKLLIGIRHPVLWFESFYNFYEGMANGRRMKHLPSNTTKLIGPCLENVNRHVCTDKARFHLQIAKVLGYRDTDLATRHTLAPSVPLTDREVELLGVDADVISSFRTQRVYNPIFVFEISQLSDSNKTRNDVFREDIRQFVGFEKKLKQVPRANRGGKRNTKTKIDICDDSHESVRAILMEHSRNTAAWIREFLLYSDSNVIISSKEYIEELMETYNHDPCESKRNVTGKVKQKSVIEKL